MNRIYQGKVTAVEISMGIAENKKGAVKPLVKVRNLRMEVIVKAAWLFPTIDTARLVLIRQKIISAF